MLPLCILKLNGGLMVDKGGGVMRMDGIAQYLYISVTVVYIDG